MSTSIYISIYEQLHSTSNLLVIYFYSFSDELKKSKPHISYRCKKLSYVYHFSSILFVFDSVKAYYSNPIKFMLDTKTT